MPTMKILTAVAGIITLAFYYLLSLTTLTGCKPHQTTTTTTTTSIITTTAPPTTVPTTVPTTITSTSSTTTSISWHLVTENGLGRFAQGSVVFDNKIWMIGGYTGGVNPSQRTFWSTDGINWTMSGIVSFLDGHQGCVVFQDKVWVIGGNLYGSNSAYSSATPDNSSSWRTAAIHAEFSRRRGHSTIVFKDKIWVIGGEDYTNYPNIKLTNDVWSSENGSSWTCMTSSAAFEPKSQHTSVVVNDRLWVIGGMDNTTGTLLPANNVWYTEDGIDWYQATDDAEFSPRYWHSSVAFENKIWVIGGVTDSGAANDVWYSTDGQSWYAATLDAEFDPIIRHKTVIYNNKMWIIGGSDINDIAFDNVWNTPWP